MFSHTVVSASVRSYFVPNFPQEAEICNDSIERQKWFEVAKHITKKYPIGTAFILGEK